MGFLRVAHVDLRMSEASSPRLHAAAVLRYGRQPWRLESEGGSRMRSGTTAFFGFARQFVQGLEFRLQAAFGGMFAFRNAPPKGGTPNGTRRALDHRDELAGKAAFFGGRGKRLFRVQYFGLACPLQWTASSNAGRRAHARSAALAQVVLASFLVTPFSDPSRKACHGCAVGGEQYRGLDRAALRWITLTTAVSRPLSSDRCAKPRGER